MGKEPEALEIIENVHRLSRGFTFVAVAPS
jgi:hypothetical protein